MLIEFRGEHSGKVMMFGKPAKQLLKMMGQSSSDEGAIHGSDDVSTALKNLKDALAKLPDVEEKNDEDEDDSANVSLHTRAVPLIDLLEANAQEGYVTWKAL